MPKPARVGVQRRPMRATAYQTDHEHFVEMSDGREVRAFPHDWIVLGPNNTVIDVISQKQFQTTYELIVEGRMILEPPQRAAIGRMLGIENIATGDLLVTAIGRLATLKVGNVEVSFTPQQWEELSRRANKLGLATVTYMQRIVDRFLQDIWTL